MAPRQRTTSRRIPCGASSLGVGNPSPSVSAGTALKVSAGTALKVRGSDTEAWSGFRRAWEQEWLTWLGLSRLFSHWPEGPAGKAQKQRLRVFAEHLASFECLGDDIYYHDE